jgi:hypothetical protein
VSFLLNISHESTDTQRNLLQGNEAFDIVKISDTLILTIGESDIVTLWGFDGDKLVKLQDMIGKTPKRICDNLFLFEDSLEVWRVHNGRAYLLDVLKDKETYTAFLYPTLQEVREVSKTLEIPVPVEICDIIVGFCAERI